MSDNDMLYAVADGVATITFNRPDKLNALTPAMLGQFFAHVDAAAADPAVRVIVITGAGRGFCAGLDLAVIGSGVGGTGVGAPPPSAPRRPCTNPLARSSPRLAAAHRQTPHRGPGKGKAPTASAQPVLALDLPHLQPAHA